MQRAATISPVSDATDVTDATDYGADAVSIADTAEALAPADQPRSASTAAFAAGASQSHVAVTRSADTADSLALLDSRELDAKFRDATVTPEDLAALEGHPRGRVLAVPLLTRMGIEQGVVGNWLRRYHASRFYPWEGKSFSTQNANHDANGGGTARGTNRVRYPARRSVFPFRVSVESSVVDQRPSIAIDYDVPENPKLVRGLYDELRALGDGLYLGRGMSRRARATGAAPRLVLWFLVDTRQQDAALR
jgi:hypothetical protein